MAIGDLRNERSAALALTAVVVGGIILLVLLFYGLTIWHWFGFAAPQTVGAAPSVTPTPAPTPSAT